MLAFIAAVKPEIVLVKFLHDVFNNFAVSGTYVVIICSFRNPDPVQQQIL